MTNFTAKNIIKQNMESKEKYFHQFRENIVGIDAIFNTPFGRQKMVYADWIASGRFYKPIEETICERFGPMVGNTHSEGTETGVTMTKAYKLAQKIIKEHVNANDDDVIISTGSGMTGVVNKLQRILGLKLQERTHSFCKFASLKLDNCLDELGEERPVVFVTHMEHHSNHTSWLETIAEVVVIPPDEDLLVKPANLRTELEKYKNRAVKIGAFSAASNVTGIIPPYYELAKIMHEYNGLCFVDFAASAPYVDIDMHPEDPMKRLDAIYFSPHKFLGGPGSTGILVFDKNMYSNSVPDNPGGGTVTWTNRWGEYHFYDDIEVREDGGTPAFLQTIKAAMSVKLKEKIGTKNIHTREKELLAIAFPKLRKIHGLHILADKQEDRIGVISFYVDDVHHNLIVRLLNDKYGVQVRGGCSCAGTYGHFLLDVDKEKSHKITDKIDSGDLTEKPGWIRLSIHPTMTNDELYFVLNAIKDVVDNVNDLGSDYYFSKDTGEYYHKTFKHTSDSDLLPWFDV